MSRERRAGVMLDRLIAKRLMGWEFFRCGYFGTEEETPRMRALQDWMDRVGIEAVGDYFIDATRDWYMEANEFRPSRDIDAAWKVVEKMREHPQARFRNLSLVSWCYNRTYATFDSEKFTDGGWSEANGDHATPLAICLAALEALEASEPVARVNPYAPPAEAQFKSAEATP